MNATHLLVSAGGVWGCGVQSAMYHVGLADAAIESLADLTISETRYVGHVPPLTGH